MFTVDGISKKILVRFAVIQFSSRVWNAHNFITVLKTSYLHKMVQKGGFNGTFACIK